MLKEWPAKQGNVVGHTMINQHGDPLTQYQVLQLFADEIRGRELRLELCKVLANQNCEFFFWECAPMTLESSKSTTFECCVVPTNIAFPASSPHTFAEKLRKEHKFTTFPNLGGDAILVAPTNGTNQEDFGNLARFLRNADEDMAQELFMHVGIAALQRLSEKPLWISTSGLGVPWLHVRLDDTPKYYSYVPYKSL